MDAAATVSNIQWTQNAFQVLATTLHLTSFLYPQQAVVNDGDVFDYIIVGAGSAGCVIATRLTEDPDIKVLLVEAGGDPPIESDIPGLVGYLKHTSVDWNYTSVDDGYSQQSHKNSVTDLTRGKMLGGSSSNNYMFYNRGVPQDFNTWTDIVNDTTWRYENVLEYFIKSEKLEDPILLKSPSGDFHGRTGYLKVTKQYNEKTKDYLKVFKELGFNVVSDINSNNTLGFTEPLLTMADGHRQSTAKSFLSKIKDRSNLYVLKNTLVTKINFDNDNNAVSVDAINENDKTSNFKANREIIISAGAINSPQLLMLSGIGPKKHLEDLGIKVISSLPVGENFHDQVSVISVYATKKIEDAPKRTNFFNTFPTFNGFVSLNKSKLVPDYQSINTIMDHDTFLSSCVFSVAFKDSICDNYYQNAKGREVLFSQTIDLYPKSRGKILLQSSNPKDYPLIHSGFFSNSVDLENAAIYTEHANCIMNSSFFKEVDAKFLVSPSCTNFEPGSKEYWKCHVLSMSTTIFHYIGTCSMGLVVDGRLRVRGVKKLRVADGSVIPTMTAGNINAPIIMIGEKAADFIKEDNKINYLKIKGNKSK
ncbi:ecdysone oxidase-like [Galleria mellonella]|uniref:Ecdysone oxidase-like n=1 Tax=Galleria mellonella TaxID=7137 RepID=A0A6J1WA35_GALME|nr:ecdysone oxidase-like [Galleria mellonella]